MAPDLRTESLLTRCVSAATAQTRPVTIVVPVYLLPELLRTWELMELFFVKGNNPMNIPAGGMTTDQQPPNLISESALPASLGATK